MSDETLSPDVPLALDPDVVTHDAPAEHPVTDHMRSTFREIYSSAAKYEEARVALVADPTLTDAAKIHADAQLRQRLVARNAPHFDRARALTRERMERLEARMAEAARPSARTAEAREVRDFVRSLPAEERLTFVHSAATRGDTETVHAVVSSLPYLSGFTMSPKEWAALRAEMYATLSPESAAELAGLRRMLDRLESAETTFAQRYARTDPRSRGIAAAVERRIAATG